MTGNLGKTIADARRARGLTQQQLASKFGEGFQVINVSRWETGKHRPSAEHVGVLHRELGIRLEDLIGEAHPPTIASPAPAGESAS